MRVWDGLGWVRMSGNENVKKQEDEGEGVLRYGCEGWVGVG